MNHLRGLLGTLPFLAGCQGAQSALDPAGAEAEAVRTLLLGMAGAGGVIWLGVTALVWFALRPGRRVVPEQSASRLIFWGGAVVPSAALIVLLTYAFWLMPSLRPFATAADDALRIEVVGRQYWWQVTYRRAGVPVIAANELRLPVGERVEVSLKSDDVIHSFWIPALGGKMDMIPGRENRLSLQANKAGVFRGACAEFCGNSHALMAMTAVVMEPADFENWLAIEAQPSIGVNQKGGDLFIRHGCGACHRVAGTATSGRLGPDLSHLGSRQMLAAGIMANTEDNLVRFIAAPHAFKPGVGMPAFSMLPAEDIRAMAVWLGGLK